MVSTPLKLRRLLISTSLTAPVMTFEKPKTSTAIDKRACCTSSCQKSWSLPMNCMMTLLRSGQAVSTTGVPELPLGRSQTDTRNGMIVGAKIHRMKFNFSQTFLWYVRYQFENDVETSKIFEAWLTLPPPSRSWSRNWKQIVGWTSWEEPP